MGFLGSLFGGAKTLAGSLTGAEGYKAANKASKAQTAAVKQAEELQRNFSTYSRNILQPYADIGANQINSGNVNFLTDPNARFQYLQSNPLFAMALENANQGTNARAAAGGKFNSGGNAGNLAQNVLLNSQPFLESRDRNIMALLGTGENAANNQAGTAFNEGINLADLRTQGGNARAAGYIGQANALSQGANNVMGALSMMRGMGGLGSLFQSGPQAGSAGSYSVGPASAGYPVGGVAYPGAANGGFSTGIGPPGWISSGGGYATNIGLPSYR